MMALQASYVFGDVFATSQKISLTNVTFVAYIVPPLMCQYLMGVLVQLDGTRFHRLALLPIAVWLAWRGAFVDMTGGDMTKVQLNAPFITQMASIATRTAVWAFAHVQYRRQSDIYKRQKSDLQKIYTACWNAWDLLVNPRGIGWNWTRGLVVPQPMYETDSRVHFLLLSTAGFVINIVAFDACMQSIRALGPDTFGTPQGGKLFDGSLPSVLGLLRSVLVAALAAAAAYFGVQYTHQLLAGVFVAVFHQHPSEWPPLFDAPWLSTSLGELWGRRWHQLMRDMVLTLGGQPFSCVFGRLGGIVGAFLASGLFHDIELRSTGRGGNSTVIVFWVMNGVGIVLERAWKRVTGRAVGGKWGRVWIAGWLLLWGLPTVDAYARVGRFGAVCLPGGTEPARLIAEFVLGLLRRFVGWFA